MVKNSLVNKSIVIVFVIFILTICIVSTTAYDIRNSNKTMLTSTWLYVGGSGPGNYTTIQHAIDNASSGDTVFVYAGVYDGGIIIDKPIRLMGENKHHSIIDGPGDKDNGIYIFSDSVVLSGFTIKNVGNFFPDCAVYIHSDNSMIYDNIITDNKFGIDVYDSVNIHIYDNMIINQDRYDGINIRFSSNIVISRNVISNNNGHGILLVESIENVIVENEIGNNHWSGLLLITKNDNDNLIYHNNFFQNIPHNSWDVGENSWYTTTPLRGNYWDDYSGLDEDDDGIGDTPYFISGGNNTDKYPFIKPMILGNTTLELSFGSFKPFTIMADIQNTGYHPAVDIKYNISLNGGINILNPETNASIEYVFPDESFEITSRFLGFGRSELTITAEALNAEKTQMTYDVFLFLFFFIVL
jgi:parallel beta-helix repeat protein